ncbi:hypothetical protein C2857_001985 [Epichloe festucae Fl1]|uniref:tRNA(Ile)-lysidine synthetase n=1 Tax=Epichloe festucae (strain Fl1) TaxID=877507 RepID=A0A7S9KK00_EPIFF|nr:hypothetical protein C2857_001985 [Epichloe festucae Fl1]
MSFPNRVLHHGPKPISLAEFRDAVESVCPPRFQNIRYARPRRVAIAVSGGVDSMAMAYLLSTLIKTHRGIRIADNPADSAFAIVVDHKLRQESSLEASKVVQGLKKLGLRAVMKPLNWKDFVQDGQNPASLPNVESVARILRYQMLGSTCRCFNANSLFFAHHRDDQYETVLMRYMSGHSYRGYQGIREANAIPECYDLHGVYKSGLLDDQMQQYPYLSFKPPNKEMKRLRWTMKSDSETEPWDRIRSRLGINDMSAHFPGHILRDVDPRVPYLTPLNCEDGGVTIYRPLLQFDKDRLIATCEANNIKWFEDPTNADATLTPRNAIRHMDRTTLPAKLQKDAILDMSREAKKRIRLEEAEARRWLIREAAILDFDPNAGTLLIEPPSFRPAHSQWRRRLFGEARSRSRQPHQRLIAALAVRKMIEFVTPDTNAPPVTHLDTVIDRIFPELAADPNTTQPKAFTIAGVAFDPIIGPACTKWFMSRAPYSSMKPLPERKLPGHLNYRISSVAGDAEEPTSRHRHWRTWKTAKLWDGRYWIRVSACVPARFHILPLVPQHAKPFRRALPPKQRARLEQILKYYAPGKIRYSLPALYSVEASRGEDANPTLTLLALPSLGIHVPGLERWVKYEARYRWIDAALLGLGRRGTQAPIVGYQQSRTSSMRVRRQRAARYSIRKASRGRSL